MPELTASVKAELKAALEKLLQNGMHTNVVTDHNEPGYRREALAQALAHTLANPSQDATKEQMELASLISYDEKKAAELIDKGFLKPMDKKEANGKSDHILTKQELADANIIAPATPVGEFKVDRYSDLRGGR